MQAWAYKYHGAEADMGIRPHADQGAVTVNCWLTPDAHNRVPGSGGLRVYNASVPDHLPFLIANRDFRAIREHVASAPRTDVDYAYNRCVVFRSALVHETLPFYFGAKYDEYRVNLSLMRGGRVAISISAKTKPGPCGVGRRASSFFTKEPASFAGTGTRTGARATRRRRCPRRGASSSAPGTCMSCKKSVLWSRRLWVDSGLNAASRGPMPFQEPVGGVPLPRPSSVASRTRAQGHKS